MNVNAWSPSAFSVVEGHTGSTPVHFAWSCDLYRSAAVTFTVNADKQLLVVAAGSGWPARRRNHFKPLCIQAIDPIVGPHSQALDRIGASFNQIMLHRMGRCRALQSEPANLSTKRGHGQIWVDNLENTLKRSWGAIGRYQAAPGAPPGRWRPPESAPTAMDGSDDVSRRGKGVITHVSSAYGAPSPTLCRRRCRRRPSEAEPEAEHRTETSEHRRQRSQNAPLLQCAKYRSLEGIYVKRAIPSNPYLSTLVFIEAFPTLSQLPGSLASGT